MERQKRYYIRISAIRCFPDDDTPGIKELEEGLGLIDVPEPGVRKKGGGRKKKDKFKDSWNYTIKN